MIDFHATTRHYAAHLAPVWDALPEEERGTFYAPEGIAPYRPDTEDVPAHERTEPENRTLRHSKILVASAWRDLRRHVGRGPKTVLMEHGAGQTYQGWHPGYAGGDARENLTMYLVPAERCLIRLPKRTIGVVVGSPWLDNWLDVKPASRKYGVTTHWHCGVHPETIGCLDEYLPALIPYAEDLIGHTHPRAAKTWPAKYRTAGIEYQPDYRTFALQASVLIADNTSAIYEFAAMGRPVIVLNGRNYRRNVNHGLRFWDLIPGREVNTPDEIESAITDIEAHRELWQERSDNIAAQVYDGLLDGYAAERAAASILSLC